MALTKIDDRGLKTPIDLLDNEKIRFGTGNDLEISHNGSNSFFKNSTGDLMVNTGNIYFANVANNENHLVITDNGSVELYYDNSKKFETTSGGITVAGNGLFSGNIETTEHLNLTADNKKIKIGAGEDLQLYADGSNSYITHNGDGNLRIFSGAAESIRCTEAGATSLFHNGTEMMYTHSTGIKLNDNKKIYLGTSADLQIYHDGSNSKISNGTGTFSISNASSEIQINKGTSEYMGRFITDGAVELYYDGTKRFETTNSGVRVIGSLYTTSYIYIDNGEDLWLEDNGKVSFGNGSDLQIYHDSTSTNNFIKAANSRNIYIQGDDVAILNEAGNQTAIWCNSGASVDLMYANSKKFETTSTGVTVTTDLVATGNINPSADGGGNLGQPAKRWYRGYFTHGIGLNGETSAGNMLDDYEEGTWSPTLTNGSSSALLIHSAFYTKIGRQVNCYMYVYSINISGSSSEFRFGGLPFTVKSGQHYGGGSIGYVGTLNYQKPLLTLVATGGSHLYFHRMDGNSASWTYQDQVNTGGGTNGFLILNVHYITDS